MDAVHFSEALQQEVAAITRQLEKRAEGGLQPTELLTVIFSCVNVMSDVGVRFLTVPVPEQKAEVTRMIKSIYDGLNPDRPWIGEPFEAIIESALFQYLVPVLYTVLIRAKAEKEEAAKVASSEEPELLQKLRAAYETSEGHEALQGMLPESEEVHTMMIEVNNAQGGEAVEYSAASAQGRDEDEATVPGQSGT